MAATFIHVLVEAHDALPDGLSMRFKAQGAPREVRRVRYEPEGREEGVFEVRAARSDGSRGAASVVPVDDSSAGSSLLVVGGDHGLRLRREGSDEAELAEAYLLLAPSAVLER